MQGSSSLLVDAWERFSVLTFLSSARWIGPSFFWSWARTAPSSVGSLMVTTGSLVHTTSFFLGGGLAADDAADAVGASVGGDVWSAADAGGSATGGAVADGFAEVDVVDFESSQPASAARERAREEARSAERARFRFIGGDGTRILQACRAGSRSGAIQGDEDAEVDEAAPLA